MDREEQQNNNVQEHLGEDIESVAETESEEEEREITLEQVEVEAYDEELDADYTLSSSSEISESDDPEEEDTASLVEETPTIVSLLSITPSFLRTRPSVRRSQRHSVTGNEVERPVERTVSFTFDLEQDGMFWATAEEKQAWVEAYEAKNCAFIERYGCRIDSFAQPEAKERLRRERRLVSKYSLVLFGLMMAYGARLLWSSIVPEPVVIETREMEREHRERVVTTWEWPQALIGWIYDSTLWPSWSVGEDQVSTPTATPRPVEDVVSQVTTAKQDTEPLVQESVSRQEPAAAKVPHTETQPAPIPVTNQIPSPSRNDVIEVEIEGSGQQSTQATGMATETKMGIEIKAAIPSADNSVDPSDNLQPETPTQTPQRATVLSSSSEILKEKPHEQDNTGERQQVVSTERIDQPKSPISPVNEDEGHAVATTTETKVEVHPTIKLERKSPETGKQDHPLPETVHKSSKKDDPPRVSDSNKQCTKPPVLPAFTTPFQSCVDMFNKLITTKNDGDVRASTIKRCNEAVAVANPLDVEWVAIHVLRGDMWSMLNEFGRADDDYNKATTKSTLFVGKPNLQSGVQLKILSNRWARFVFNKQHKELRQECQRVVSSPPSALFSKETRELANDWLRVFKKELKAYEVLIKSKSWTSTRLQIDK